MNQDEIIQFEQWREALRELLLVKEVITAAEISRKTKVKASHISAALNGSKRMTLSKQIKVSKAIGITHDEMVIMGTDLLNNGGSDYHDQLHKASKKESEVNDIIERLSDILKSCDDGVIESVKGNLKLWEDLQMMRRNKPPKLG